MRPYRSNILLFFIQHYYMFRLSTSAIFKRASVHKKSRKYRFRKWVQRGVILILFVNRYLPDDGWCRLPKHVIVLN